MSENGLWFGKPRAATRWPSEAGGGERQRPMAAPGSHRDPPTASPLVTSLWEILGPHERAWWHSLSQSWSNSLFPYSWENTFSQLISPFLSPSFLQKGFFSALLEVSLPPNSSLKGKEWICVCPSPRQMSTVCFIWRAAQTPSALYQQPTYPLLNQGLRTGFVRMLWFGDRTSQWHRTAQNSLTRATTPLPGPNLRSSLLLFLKHISKRNHGHTRGSSWIMFSYQSITEMKIFSCKALLPHPNLHLHVFHPSEHWLCQQVGQRGSWGWFSRGHSF